MSDKSSKNTRSIKSTKSIAGLGVAATVLAVAPVIAPQAAAAPVQAQQNYTCAITVDENPTEPSFMDLTTNVSLNLPDQVAPGDQVSISGHLSVQLAGERAGLCGVYFPSAQVTSDGLTIPVSVGGQEQLVGTSYIDSRKIDTRQPPLVFGGDFTTNPITVPTDAQGDLSFTMPRNGSVPAISRDGMAAFTATLIAEGGIVPGYDKGTDRVSCDLNAGAPASLGSVPIGAAASVGAAGAAGGTANGAPQVTSVSPGATAATGASTNRVQAAQGAAAPATSEAAKTPGETPAVANDASAQATRELADQMRLLSMNQAASRDDGSHIPLSVIGWGTVGVVLASVLFTVAMNVRTSRLRRAAEDY